MFSNWSIPLDKIEALDNENIILTNETVNTNIKFARDYIGYDFLIITTFGGGVKYTEINILGNLDVGETNENLQIEYDEINVQNLTRGFKIPEVLYI